MSKWNDYKSGLPIDMALSEQRKRNLEIRSKEQQDRYNTLPILIDITNTLARLRLSFRGHDKGDIEDYFLNSSSAWALE